MPGKLGVLKMTRKAGGGASSSSSSSATATASKVVVVADVSSSAPPTELNSWRHACTLRVRVPDHHRHCNVRGALDKRDATADADCCCTSTRVGTTLSFRRVHARAAEQPSLIVVVARSNAEDVGYVDTPLADVLAPLLDAQCVRLESTLARRRTRVVDNVCVDIDVAAELYVNTFTLRQRAQLLRTHGAALLAVLEAQRHDASDACDDSAPRFVARQPGFDELRTLVDDVLRGGGDGDGGAS